MVNHYPLTPHITPSYTHKMANVSWPQILWHHFTQCTTQRYYVYWPGCMCKGGFAAEEQWTAVRELQPINQSCIFRVVQVIKSLHDPLEVGNNLPGINDNVRERGLEQKKNADGRLTETGQISRCPVGCSRRGTAANQRRDADTTDQ